MNVFIQLCRRPDGQIKLKQHTLVFIIHQFLDTKCIRFHRCILNLATKTAPALQSPPKTPSITYCLWPIRLCPIRQVWATLNSPPRHTPEPSSCTSLFLSCDFCSIAHFVKGSAPKRSMLKRSLISRFIVRRNRFAIPDEREDHTYFTSPHVPE